jgi:crotonobetainyl-CoA:carnitine CoA-transferase CaiB-like acyl-CoA transferase
MTLLNNIRILDFTRVLAGPYATRLLADFGAEVIKVQPLIPLEGDDVFSRGYYDTWNRNKLGVTLNLSKPEGIELAKRLAARCDAVVENFTPRVMANWGLDYPNLKKVKQDIIMVSLSVNGQTGPRRNFTGFGATVQALSGLTHLTSFPEKPPTGPGFSYADHIAGLCASLALLGALEHRRKTGDGRYIDISEVEATASLLGGAILEASVTGKEPERTGNRSNLAAPHNVYRCKDNHWCAITVFSDGEWEGFKRALGNPTWAEDEKFASLSGRLVNTEELDKLVESWARRFTAAEVVSKLQENGVAAGLVQNAADLARDPQLKDRGFFVERPELGILIDATPIKLSRTRAEYKRKAPSPGQDNEYVFKELLGLSDEEMKALNEKGVI